MERETGEGKQPWGTCFLTDILISYVEETLTGNSGIDYPGLFQGAQGFQIPPDPRLFLKDIGNWVSLPILRQLLSQREKISGKKGIAYHATRAYFDPRKKDFLSLFKIIFRRLNDIHPILNTKVPQSLSTQRNRMPSGLGVPGDLSRQPAVRRHARHAVESSTSAIL